MEVDKDTKGETGKKRMREEEKEECETVIVERRCVKILVKGRIGRAVAILEVTCEMILLACLTVILGLGRVCLVVLVVA